MAITKLTKHNSHRMVVKLLPQTHQHHAELRCIDCDKWIQWVKVKEYPAIKEMINA